MTSARRLLDDGGAVIVEAALVLPVLLAIFFGLFEYSERRVPAEPGHVGGAVTRCPGGHRPRLPRG